MPKKPSDAKYGYIFFRKGGWYPWECDSDEDAVKQAEMNPGTLKVTAALTNRVVWTAPSSH